MSLAVIGLNHRSGSLEARERLYFAEDETPRALSALHERLGGGGAVILSTCNRVEIYLNTPGNATEALAKARSFWFEWRGAALEECANHLYTYTGQDAVEHLFRVCSSLDSLIVGEAQILGQVQAAFRAAQMCETTDKILNALFEKAFSVAKKVRRNSVIGKGKVSIGSIAVDVAVSIFGELKDKTVLVIGSGKMGEITLNHLTERGVGRILIANRSQDKAEAAAERFGGVALPASAIGSRLHEADIVISSTAAPGHVLGCDAFRRALKRRGKAPMLAVDIAVPRDIDPAVHELGNVYLYHMDDLRQVADDHLAHRKREMARCSEMVEHGVEQFWKWLQGLAAEPAIVSMSREVDVIRARELEKTLAALSHLPQEDLDEIAYMSKRLVNAVLQRPMRQLKREVVDHDPSTVLPFVNRLFGLNGSF